MAVFKKNSRKWFIVVVVLLAGIGYMGLAYAKGEEKVIAKPGISPFSELVPKVEVSVDMEIVKANQQSVDQGHSPWQLDPMQTTITFVSLQIHPEGITGEFPIKLGDLKLIKQTASEAVVKVSGANTPISRVYLKRFIRQDDTGIWTVVGYDPKE